jgi:hypothetical protein
MKIRLSGSAACGLAATLGLVLTISSASGRERDRPSGEEEGKPGDLSYQEPGVKDNLPVFRDRLAEHLTFPLSWLSGKYERFETWHSAGRAKVIECLLAPPSKAPFDPVILTEQDRGSYMARKVVF